MIFNVIKFCNRKKTQNNLKRHINKRGISIELRKRKGKTMRRIILLFILIMNIYVLFAQGVETEYGNVQNQDSTNLQADSIDYSTYFSLLFGLGTLKKEFLHYNVSVNFAIKHFCFGFNALVGEEYNLVYKSNSNNNYSTYQFLMGYSTAIENAFYSATIGIGSLYLEEDAYYNRFYKTYTMGYKYSVLCYPLEFKIGFKFGSFVVATSFHLIVSELLPMNGYTISIGFMSKGRKKGDKKSIFEVE